jgi:guanine deaminase
MDIAYNEAIKGINANNGGPFGAVIVRKNVIIASAHNEVLTNKDPTAHAEINAIRKASQVLNSYDLSECTLYTTCEPCPMCLGAILWARIGRVYYVSTKEDATDAGFDDNHFYDVLEGNVTNTKLTQIEHEDSKNLFELWKNKGDIQIY